MKLNELTLEQKALLTSPYGFGKFYLGLPINDAAGEKQIGECRGENNELFYPIFENDRQKQVVNAIEPQCAKVSVRTCNGAGKTTVLIPTTVLWFMTMHPRAKVVITSGVERQVRGQLFPALHAHKSRLEGWKFNDADISAPNGSMAIGFSTNDGQRFEGWHGNKDAFYDLLQHDGPLMIVVDEGKSVAQTIFDAIDRCTYQRLLIASSCGGSIGEFYRSHTSNARFYKTFHIPTSHCPHADHAKNRELIIKRGLLDPLVRSKVFAEFMEGAEGTVIKAAWITQNRISPPAAMNGPQRVFCDFAAGGDENVIAYRIGNRVRIAAAWREKDTMRACGQFIDHFRKMGITPATCPQICAGDNGGLGKVILDRLAELGWVLQRVNNGGKAREKCYKNIAAQTWYEGAKAIEQGRIVLEDLDDLTIAQLTERTGYTDSAGVLCLEPKEDMKARGLDSPDRADALLGALASEATVEPIAFGGQHDADTGLFEQLTQQHGLAELPGAFAG
jgi:phage terminase large subunit